MNTSTKFIIGIGILIAATSLAAAYPVNSNQLSCTTYDLHDIEMSSITYSDESHNNHDATKYMEPGEKVTLEFHYNLPACDNAVDHSRHVVSFYNSEGEFLGQKTDLQMNQGNWDSSYTVYNVPVRIPEFNTTSVQIETDIYASSVHGSDVWHESNSEEAYDKVIRDTVPEEEGALNLEELPIDSEDINDLKNTRQTSNFWGDCVDLPETINNNSYVTNPNMPGLRISQNNWYMDSGGGHPCYIFSAYEQARALYNWYSVIDTTGPDGEIGAASTCGPNPNRQHNGGGESLNHVETFKRACPDDDGEWVASNIACDGSTRKKASNHQGSLIQVTTNGDTTYYASDGSRWWSVNQTDSSQAACNAFINAQGQGNWTTDSIIAEASGQAGGPCNLGLTNDKFIAGNALYEDGKSTVCREGTQESVTINGQTYYCRGVTN